MAAPKRIDSRVARTASLPGYVDVAVTRPKRVICHKFPEGRALSDFITLLEAIGADATLMSADPAELRESLESVGLAPALCSALLDGDVQTLRELLRAPEIVCCIIDPAEEEDDEEEEEDGEDEDDGDETVPARQPKPRGSPL